MDEAGVSRYEVLGAEYLRCAMRGDLDAARELGKDEVGLTERGAQQVGAPIPGPFLARSIFGRSTRLSVSYYF